MSETVLYLVITTLIVLTILVAIQTYVQIIRQNTMKQKTVSFIKNMETAAEEAVDEGFEEAFGEDSEFDDLFQRSIQLQQATFDEQCKTNILLTQIKEILEKDNVSIN